MSSTQARLYRTAYMCGEERVQRMCALVEPPIRLLSNNCLGGTNDDDRTTVRRANGASSEGGGGRPEGEPATD